MNACHLFFGADPCVFLIYTRLLDLGRDLDKPCEKNVLPVRIYNVSNVSMADCQVQFSRCRIFMETSFLFKRGCLRLYRRYSRNSCIFKISCVEC